MKSNIFDINRFGLLIKKKFIENKSTTIYEVIGIVAVLCFIMGFIALTGRGIDLNTMSGLFGLGLIVLGIIYADRAFSETKSKSKGMLYLLTPASRFEKLLLAIFYTSVFFPIGYFVVFNVVYELFSLIFTGKTGGLVYMPFDNHVSVFCKYLIYQSVYMLGSIWFGKRSLLKTTAVIVFFYIVLFLIVAFMLNMNLLKSLYDDSIPSISIRMSNEIFTGEWLHYLLWLFPPFFWVVTYFRLSEKQI